MSFENTFKYIDDILYKDAGCDSELDYAEQISWMLFLKYLDDLEETRKISAELKGDDYEYIIEEEYRWSSWAQPLTADGKIDDNAKKTGVDLIEFVNKELWPYLRIFSENSPKTIEHRIGEIFNELNNRIQSGYNLRDCIDRISELKFQTSEEKHELSDLYETRIKNMGNAGRNGGQYYTPKPLIRAMVEMIDPKIGETVYDGACGSAGFLVETYNHLVEKNKNLSATDFETIQTRTLYGREKSPLAYLIGVMNMILHGIEVPNITKMNTLGINTMDIQEGERFNIILANPPFGGSERVEFQENFSIKTSETSFLFLQHFIKSLKTGGRAAIVIKNTVLSNDDNGAINLRKQLLASCNIHAILDLPKKTFAGAGVKTVVLFFTKGKPTKKIWYYQLTTEKNLGKTNPLRESHLEEFLSLQLKKPNTPKSWTIDVEDVDTKVYDLSVINPMKPKKEKLRTPIEITNKLEESLDYKFKSIKKLGKYTATVFEKLKNDSEMVKIGDCCTVIAGQSPNSKFYNKNAKGLPFYQGKKEFTDRIIGNPTTWTTEITKEAIKNDILMSVRAPVGPVNIASQKICIGRGLAAIRAGEKVNVEYLFYYFLHHEKEINGKEGAVFNSISKGGIENLMIPLPAIDKQNEIVVTLNQAHTEVSKVESILNDSLSDLKDLKKSLMSVAYEQIINE